MTTARQLATEHIARRARRFPDLEPKPLDTTGLEGRDAAFALALDHAVVRHWLTLEHLISGCLSRPWEKVETKLQATLLVGAVQLFFFERIPAHAAIDEMVNVARTVVRPGAAGMTNAVLRRLAGIAGSYETAPLPNRDALPLGDGRWRDLTEPVLPTDTLERLSVTTSHPIGVLRHWLAVFGAEKTEHLAHHGLIQAPVIIADLPPDGGHGLPAHDIPGFHAAGHDIDIAAVLHDFPGARVQDPSSARAVGTTAGLSPKVIMDYCAGKGTKTRQLARLHPDAEIIATDRDAFRYQVLRDGFEGSDQVRVVPFDEIESEQGRVDLLVLDVPCSNSGVFARRVEAKYRFNPTTLSSLGTVQKQIVADTLSLLSDDAHMLYATCSVEPMENQEQWAWCEQWHRCRTVSSDLTLPHGVPGDPATTYTDGGATALLAMSSGAAHSTSH